MMMIVKCGCCYDVRGCSCRLVVWLLGEEGIGCVVFSPLAQGLLTDKYLRGIPGDSRAAKPHGALQAAEITPERIEKLQQLNQLSV